MGDNIWLDDRDGVRTPMQWDTRPNSGFSCGDIPPKRLYSPLIDDERFGYRNVNVASQRADQGSFWHTLRRMIAVRKGQHALGDGGCEFLPVVNPAGLALVRTNGGETILALHNLLALPQAIELDLSRWQEATVGNLLSARRFPTVGDRPYRITFRPYEYLWLKL
jgi:maltose alpha-D-glucosyltransferase/alpha-amylase